MENDFDNWNSIKKDTSIFETITPDFHEREIWWCKFGKNIGYEQDGKNNLFERPVLVYKKFNRNLFFGIPLTSRYKENKFYYKLEHEEVSVVLLSQLRTLDAKRLIRKIRVISKSEYLMVQEALLKIM